LGDAIVRSASEGLSDLYLLHRPELRRFLVARTSSEADADDVLNDLWLKIAGATPGPIANGRSYLFKMANNLVLDRVREARRRDRRNADWTKHNYGIEAGNEEAIDDALGAEEMLIESDNLRRLADAIAALPFGAQRVLRMHKLDGLSHAEISARLGISKSAVEKHMATAMAHLRRLLTD